MVIADDPGDFPRPVFVLPQVDEAPLADRFGILMTRMVKAVNADFHRAIALHVVNLQRRGQELSRRFAANVLLDALGQPRAAEGDAALVVVKLDVVYEEALELFQIAFVVSIEKSGIERG